MCESWCHLVFCAWSDLELLEKACYLAQTCIFTKANSQHPSLRHKCACLCIPQWDRNTLSTLLILWLTRLKHYGLASGADSLAVDGKDWNHRRSPPPGPTVLVWQSLKWYCAHKRESCFFYPLRAAGRIHLRQEGLGGKENCAKKSK